MASSTANNDPLSGKTKMLMSLIKYNQPGYAVKHWAAIAAKNGMSVAKVKISKPRQHFAKVRNEHLKATQDGPPPAPVAPLDDRDNQSPVAAANDGDDANNDEDLVAPPIGANRATPSVRPARATRPAPHASPARPEPGARPTRASRVAGSTSASSTTLAAPNAPNAPYASSALSLRDDKRRSSQIQRIEQGQRAAAYDSIGVNQEKAGPTLPRHWHHSNALGLKRPSDLGRDEDGSDAKKAKTSSVFDNHTHEEVRQMFDQEIAEEEARQGIVWGEEADAYMPASSQPPI
ncbi:hypothetical protein PG995_003173 [Apiospora arundinis]